MTEEKRFERHVVAGSGGCRIWVGALRNGYGVFRSQGRVVGAHRWAYGTVPAGSVVAACPADKRCVNREHLGLRRV